MNHWIMWNIGIRPTNTSTKMHTAQFLTPVVNVYKIWPENRSHVELQCVSSWYEIFYAQSSVNVISVTGMVNERRGTDESINKQTNQPNTDIEMKEIILAAIIFLVPNLDEWSD